MKDLNFTSIFFSWSRDAKKYLKSVYYSFIQILFNEAVMSSYMFNVKQRFKMNFLSELLTKI